MPGEGKVIKTKDHAPTLSKSFKDTDKQGSDKQASGKQANNTQAVHEALRKHDGTTEATDTGQTNHTPMG